MLNNINKTDLFYDYYAQWITVYKEGAIRKVTMDKYLLTQAWIKQLAPDLKVCELSRITYAVEIRCVLSLLYDEKVVE